MKTLSNLCALLLLACSISSCTSGPCPKYTTLGKKSVKGQLQLRKGWIIGGVGFHDRHSARLHKLNEMIGGKEVEVTGMVVRCSVHCPEKLQCRTGKSYDIFDTINSIEVIKHQ